MDALKKFINKKKSDKAFKSAGPGHKLTETGSSPKKSSGSSGAGGSSKQQQHQHSHHSQSGQQKGGQSVTTEEKRAAAAAALARLEKTQKPGNVDADQLRQTRQTAFIREQARKELEAEKLNQSQQSPDKNPKKDNDLEVGPSTARKSKDPEDYAVSGVYFSCPLIGPEILTKTEIEENIKQFLLEQPEEELGVTACLLIKSCNKPFERVTNCVETLCKYLDNIITNPAEIKFRKIRCSNKVFQEKVVTSMGAEHFLRAAGFRRTMMKADPEAAQEEEFWVFYPPTADSSSFVAHLTELRDMLKQTTPIRPELDRNLQVLMPVQVTKRRELPDEFYSLSLEEVRKEQVLKSEMAEKELSLRTKEMRERDEKREQRLYRYAIMRIRFPDGFTLQGTFKAHEKLCNLYEFVNENLVEEVKFQLVRSGGEPLSDMNATLAEMKLAPSSILNFKVDSAPAPLATGEISFLRPEILALVQPAM